MTAFLKAWTVLKNREPIDEEFRQIMEQIYGFPIDEFGDPAVIGEPIEGMEHAGGLDEYLVGTKDYPARQNHPHEYDLNRIVDEYRERGSEDTLSQNMLMEELARQKALAMDRERQEKLQVGVEMANPGNVPSYRYPRGGHR